MLEAGQTVPPLQGILADGSRIDLADFRGRWLVVYFYPKDNTPGCTREAQDFRAPLHAAFRRRGAEVLGVSRDSVKSHQGFAARHELAFPLLADVDEAWCRAFDVIHERCCTANATTGRSAQHVPHRPEGRLAQVVARREGSGPRPSRAREHSAAVTRPGPTPALCRRLARRSDLPLPAARFPMTRGKRIYVLDTNVLMHDPTALFRFEEHDIFLPMTVLEELDSAKKGMSEVARNARQVSRFINELIEHHGRRRIEGPGSRFAAGRDPQSRQGRGPTVFPDTQRRGRRRQVKADNLIPSLPSSRCASSPAGAGRAGVERHQHAHQGIDRRVTAEDYENDRALDDFSLLYAGHAELPVSFWTQHQRDLRSWSERSHTYHEVKLRKNEAWFPHQCLYLPDAEGEDEGRPARARTPRWQGSTAIAAGLHRHAQRVGIAARNREQNFALNPLMDPDVDFVTLLGTAGTGKTLLALAAGLAQVMDQQLPRDHHDACHGQRRRGHRLPARHRGGEDDAVDGALTDNLEVLSPIRPRAGPGASGDQ